MPYKESILNDGLLPIIGPAGDLLRTVNEAVRRLSQRRLPVINAAYYGVKTRHQGGLDYDSTDAVQAVINIAKQSRDGVEIVWPPGDILITRDLDGNYLNSCVMTGAGARRSLASGYDSRAMGTTFYFEGTAWGLDLFSCLGVLFQNIAFVGDTTTNGLRIRSQNGAGTSSIHFSNCAFHAFATAIGCGPQGASPTFNSNDSEVTFNECQFNDCTTGFLTTHAQSLAHRFINCTASTITVMFDLDAGGCITVVGFGASDILTLIDVGAGGSGIGTNLFLNTRLEGSSGAWGAAHRTKLYLATASGTSRTIFHGLIFGGTETDDATTRITLRTGHQVFVHNAVDGGSGGLCTATSPLAEWISGGSDKSRLVVVDSELVVANLVKGSLIGISEYSLIRPYTTAAGRTADAHYPALSLSATRTFYAASSSGGSPTVLNTVTLVDGLITAWSQV